MRVVAALMWPKQFLPVVPNENRTQKADDLACIMSEMLDSKRVTSAEL